MTSPVATLPANANELLTRSQKFNQEVLAVLKRTPPAPGFDWYPYDTMASVGHLSPLLQDHFAHLERAIRSGPMLDIGCADGDLGLFFSSLGCDLTAVDNPPTNFNWMNGVRALRDRSNFPVEVVELDIDSQFTLQDKQFGLTLLLGILYHLKNPYYVLETLAKKSRYCILSTRIASVTKSHTDIHNEPVAFLLDHREANDDATNYWIFSPAGLLRIAKRSGWRVLSHTTVGCTTSPNPIDPDADGRMFLFMRSQLLSAPAKITLLDGWCDTGAQAWAWTLKRFSFQAELQQSFASPKFLIGFVIPASITSVSPVTMSCQVNGIDTGTQTFLKHGDQIYEAPLPGNVDQTKPMQFDFSVKHSFSAAPDTRDLGIIMPFTGAIQGLSEPILFWLE